MRYRKVLAHITYLYILVRKAGLKWSDITPIWLTPADARAAFQKGAVDAWAIWDPYYASAQLEDQARVLASGKVQARTIPFT